MRRTQIYSICDWIDLVLALNVMKVLCSTFQWPYFEGSTHHTQSTLHTQSRSETQTILTSKHKMRRTHIYSICDWLDLVLALNIMKVLCSTFPWPYFEGLTHHTQSTLHTQSRSETQTCSPFQWPYFESSTHHTQSTLHTQFRFKTQTS